MIPGLIASSSTCSAAMTQAIERFEQAISSAVLIERARSAGAWASRIVNPCSARWPTARASMRSRPIRVSPGQWRRISAAISCAQLFAVSSQSGPRAT